MLFGKEHYKEILFTDEKIFTLEETFNKKKIEFMHSHSRKPRNWCQGSNEVIILFGGVSYDGVSPLHFCAKGVKTVARNC